MSPKREEITIAGAGLAGSLLAVYLARHGFNVTVYERSADMRKQDVPAGRSINLALANRGLRALKQVGLDAQAFELLTPMRGRMLHQENGELQFQAYGQRDNEVIYSVSRTDLNRLLLDAADANDNVTFHFSQACRGYDPETGQLALHDAANDREYTVTAPHLVAADGGGSVIRRELAKRQLVEAREDLLTHGYKELTIPHAADGSFRMEPHALHIWPRGEFMLIALPNQDQSFTTTLFMPNEGKESFAALDSEESLIRFFEDTFPDALEHLPDICSNFFARPTGLLGTVRCAPWRYQDKVVLLGDAAHAIVPFHGQGMNCAFEDCAAFDDCVEWLGTNWAKVFEEFESRRRENANAIADMALENYVEMRDSVRDPQFHLNKEIAWRLERRFPELFIPRYSMVMFHHLPYAQAMSRGIKQQEIVKKLAVGLENPDHLDFERAEAMIEATLAPV